MLLLVVAFATGVITAMLLLYCTILCNPPVSLEVQIRPPDWATFYLGSTHHEHEAQSDPLCLKQYTGELAQGQASLAYGTWRSLVSDRSGSNKLRS